MGCFGPTRRMPFCLCRFAASVAHTDAASTPIPICDFRFQSIRIDDNSPILFFHKRRFPFEAVAAVAVDGFVVAARASVDWDRGSEAVDLLAPGDESGFSQRAPAAFAFVVRDEAFGSLVGGSGKVAEFDEAVVEAFAE